MENLKYSLSVHRQVLSSIYHRAFLKNDYIGFFFFFFFETKILTAYCCGNKTNAVDPLYKFACVYVCVHILYEYLQVKKYTKVSVIISLGGNLLVALLLFFIFIDKILFILFYTKHQHSYLGYKWEENGKKIKECFS